MSSGLRKALVFGMQFLPLFAVSLWLYPRILPVYERGVLAVVNPYFARLTPSVRMESDSEGRLLAYVALPGVPEKPLFDSSYPPYVIYLNLVVLPALLLATPVSAGKRLQLLGLGVALLFVCHVLSMIGLLRTNLCLLKDPDSFLCDWMNGLFVTSGQTSVVVGWALLTWSHWFPRPAVVPVGDSGRRGRNAPCPCGSGRKYKSCCGGPRSIGIFNA